jgi:hypothetical protein
MLTASWGTAWIAALHTQRPTISVSQASHDFLCHDWNELKFLLTIATPVGAAFLYTQDKMTPTRFSECLLHIRWTPINLASALQCDLSWVEALEAGAIEVPEGLALWLERLAQCHETTATPTEFRGRGHD